MCCQQFCYTSIYFFILLLLFLKKSDTEQQNYTKALFFLKVTQNSQNFHCTEFYPCFEILKFKTKNLYIQKLTFAKALSAWFGQRLPCGSEQTSSSTAALLRQFKMGNCLSEYIRFKIARENIRDVGITEAGPDVPLCTDASQSFLRRRNSRFSE